MDVAHRYHFISLYVHGIISLVIPRFQGEYCYRHDDSMEILWLNGWLLEYADLWQQHIPDGKNKRE